MLPRGLFSFNGLVTSDVNPARSPQGSEGGGEQAGGRALTMAALVLAGETIYALPYYLRRDFAPVMSAEMGLSNEELGWLSSAFGVFALLRYFPGGWLADRFPARGLLTFSLASTGVGGLFLATLPGYRALLALFALWGVSSVLTFWAALIKATRAWGGADGQGRAFGLLDGGRGLVGWLLGMFAVAVFGSFLEPRAGLRAVILMYSGAAILSALVVFRVVPLEPESAADAESVELPTGSALARLGAVVRSPIAWLQALIILAAYAGYWGTFDVAGYATDAYGFEPEAAASLSANLRFLRPLAAVAAGVVADRFGATRTVAATFVVMIAAYASLASLPPDRGLWFRLVVETAAACASAFALRGIFYAVMSEGRLPMHLTGTTVGLVSVIGYSPDIFIPPLMGRLIDVHGVTGHRVFFGVLVVGTFVGLVASLVALRIIRALPAREASSDSSGANATA